MEMLIETGTMIADVVGRGNGLDWCDVGDAMRSPALVGESEAVRRLRSQVERIGPYFRTALLTGEAGTGKEMVAQALRGFSRWAGGPFVVCDAAVEDVSRAVRAAESGVLFLDHVGEMTPAAQDALVRTLDEWSEARARAGEDRRLPVRIVAATHRDLRTMTIAGRFRKDLYGRIAVVEIAVPSLRARLADLGAIAEAMSRREGCRLGVTREAMELMAGYSWPGNLDELKGVMERAVRDAEGGPVEARHVRVLSAGHEADRVAADNATNEKKIGSKVEKLEAVIERYVMDVLTQCGGNKLRTAELLGISRSTLYRMLETCVAGRGMAVSG